MSGVSPGPTRRHGRPRRRCGDDDAYANLLLPVRIAEARLSPADAGLATELCYGTLRGRGYDDRIIALAANRPVERIDAKVLDVLRMGVHQLLRMRVPAHAVLDESVKLVRVVGATSAAGFVNGVLRTITRTSPEEWRERVLEGLTGDERLAAEFSHPVWIVAAFRDALAAEGREAELEELLDADNAPPRVSLVALPGLSDPDEVGEPGTVSPVAARSPGGDPAGIPDVAAGRARVQDEGSQLAALALSPRPPDPRRGALARPVRRPGRQGGAARRGGRARRRDPARERAGPHPGPARASGRSRSSSRRPRSSSATVGDSATARSASTASCSTRPCTGLGALRRRPEARWRKRPEDVERARRAADRAARGGDPRRSRPAASSPT